MTESLPDWLAVPLIVILCLSALYRCYILPVYLKDRETLRKVRNLAYNHGKGAEDLPVTRQTLKDILNSERLNNE